MADLLGHTPPRPMERGETVLATAALKVAADIAKWAKDGLGYDDPDELSDIARAISGTADGYEIARRLEDDLHIQPDAELVDILDQASMYISDAHKAEVKQWVVENNVTLVFAVGDRVYSQRFECPGTVTILVPETAQYCVKLEDGKQRGAGYGGTYCEAEQVVALEPEPAAAAAGAG